MEREIVLSPYSVKKKGNNKPENFVNKFTKPAIVLDNNYEYAFGLNRIINMSFTWFNINADYGNQLIRFSSDAGTNFTDMTFPQGVWTYSDFDAYIKKKTVIKATEYPTTLAFDDTTFKVTVTLKTNFQLDLTKSNSYELIGFDKEVLKTAGYNEGKKDTRSVSRYRYPQHSL